MYASHPMIAGETLSLVHSPKFDGGWETSRHFLFLGEMSHDCVGEQSHGQNSFVNAPRARIFRWTRQNHRRR